MLSPLIQKLDHSGFLRDEDRSILRDIASASRRVAARSDLIQEDDRPENVYLILEGFACRYKLMPSGRRQIMAILLPGDFCDLHVAILGRMDHSISTLSPCTVVDIPRTTIEDLTERHARITRAFWWATLTDEGILREWLANMGQREAPRQMAHLFCELLMRLQTVDLAGPNGYDLPVTQVDLADILGLTSVHVNRVLQELRAAGLIALARGRLEIPDVAALKSFCDFNPNYLHLTPRTASKATERFFER